MDIYHFPDYFFVNKLFTSNGYTPIKIIGLSVVSSLIFFVFSNYAVWLGFILYSPDTAGLTACFIAAIPFLMNEMAGTLFYSCLFLVFTGFMNTDNPKLPGLLSDSDPESENLARTFIWKMVL